MPNPPRSLAFVAPVAAGVIALVTATSAGAQLWEVGARTIAFSSGNQVSQDLGDAIAVGDFDGDGDDDLVIGARWWDNGASSQNGRFEAYRSGPNRGFTSVLVQSIAGSGSYFAAALVLGNFDSDSAFELAVGIPGADVSYNDASVDAAGRVDIYDWNGSTLAFVRSFVQSDLSDSVPESGDWFGAQLTVGDFDGDGIGDLVIGVPLENLSTTSDTGMVHVVYGAASGLSEAGTQAFFAGDLVGGTNLANSTFGDALAAGDFDGDGYDDLAVGAPTRDDGVTESAGAVHIVYGSLSGLTDAGTQYLTDLDFGGTRDAYDWFGYALAAGDFDNPGGLLCFLGSNCADDLAIGVPGQNVDFGGLQTSAGKVVVAWGDETSGELETAAAEEITQDDLNLWTGPESGDYFGYVLEAGNFDQPSASLSDPRVAVDLAIGVPDENLVGIQSGVMHLVFGSDSGFQGAWTLPYPGFAIAFGETGDRFASSLAAGDFDGDGAGDLAVGITGRDLPGTDNAGAVQILFGALFASGFENGDLCLWSAPGCA